MRLDKYDRSAYLAHIRDNECEEIMTFSNPVLKPHVSINVRNIERSVDFYRRMFGTEPVKVRTGYAKFDIQNPPLNFAMNEVAGLDGAGALSHLGFQVASTDDVLRIRKGWADAGLMTRDEMDTNCCYANQNKTWVTDPDGNEWEAFVVLRDDVNDARSNGCATSAKPDPVEATCCR